MKKIALYIIFLAGISINFNLVTSDNQEHLNISKQVAKEFEQSIPAFNEVVNGFGERTANIAKNIGIFAFGSGLEYVLSKSGYRLVATGDDLRIKTFIGIIFQLSAHYHFSDTLKDALINALSSFKDIALLVMLTDVFFKTSKNGKYAALGALYAKELLGLGYYGVQRLALSMLNKDPERYKQKLEEHAKSQ